MTAHAVGGSPTIRRLLLATLLLVPAVAVFGPGLRYPFVALDDVYYVVTNPAIRDLSWHGIRHLFLEDTRDLRYFPVSYLSFALDYRLFGLDPFAFHLTNLLLHLANTLLVALLVERVFRDRALALGTALLFSIHPLQVESVTWVMSRKNVLFLFFFLVSALAYLGFLRRWPARRAPALALLAASAASYLVAGLAKTSAIPLPAALVVIDLALDPTARTHPGAFLRWCLPSKLAYLPPALLLVEVSLRYSAPNPFRRDFGFDILEWTTVVGHNFFFFVLKTLLPTGLAAFYPLPPAGGVPAAYALYGAMALALAGVAVWCLWRGWSVPFFGLAWYFVTIAPNTVYAVFFSDFPILTADRYYYQSAIGLLLLPVAAFLALWRSRARLRPLLAAAAATALLALCAISMAHARDWRSTATLYETIVSRYPNDEFYYRLALEYAGAHHQADAFRALEAAERAPRKLFYSNFLFFRLQLARVYLAEGDLARAADQVEAGIEATPNALEPGDARTPLAFRYLADLRRRAGDEAGAARALGAAAGAATDPGYAFELAFAQALPQDADRFLHAQVATTPDDAEAWFGWGIVAQVAGDETSARARFDRARSLGYRPPAGFGSAGP